MRNAVGVVVGGVYISFTRGMPPPSNRGRPFNHDGTPTVQPLPPEVALCREESGWVDDDEVDGGYVCSMVDCVGVAASEGSSLLVICFGEAVMGTNEFGRREMCVNSSLSVTSDEEKLAFSGVDGTVRKMDGRRKADKVRDAVSDAGALTARSMA